MPHFTYEAQDTTGQTVLGALRATSQREAIRRLNELKLLPLKIAEQSSQAVARTRLSRSQLASLYQMLADLLESGMPLLKSLELVASQATNPAVATMLTEVTSKVAEGSSLANALETYPHTFDELTCNMVRAGEEGGFLEESLKRVATLHERRAALTNNLAGALAYPAFLLLVGILVVTGMIVFFVPKFEPLFQRLRDSGELPWSTTTLLNFSSLLRHHGVWLFIAAAAGWLLLAAWLRTPAARLSVDRWKLRARLLGPILTAAALAVYCRVLGTLLSNGVPMLDALRIAKGTTGNRALQELVHQAALRVTAGASLAENLASDRLIPREIIEVIRIGEKSNRLDTVLLKIADQLDLRTERQLGILARLVEPALMVIMAIAIGFLMLALLMPVFLSSGRFG
jgi:general secretion pathway protein F